MPIVCLIGRHGSGKSTLGKAMQAYGYHHISVGTLRRLAANNQFPCDVPYALMVMMRRSAAGRPLSDEAVAKLLAHAYEFRNCVIDGFPASTEHVDMLPADCVLGYVWAPKSSLGDRLTLRAEQTVRQWTPGRASTREEQLAEVASHARSRRRVIFVPNRGDRGAVEQLAGVFVKQIAREPKFALA